MNMVEARRNFSEIIARVACQHQRVVIERRGRPMAALISIEDLRRLEAIERDTVDARARREAALAAAAAARAAIRAERGGAPLPDSGETLARLREECSHEPSDLR